MPSPLSLLKALRRRRRSKTTHFFFAVFHLPEASMQSFAAAVDHGARRRSGGMLAAPVLADDAVRAPADSLWQPTRLIADRGRFILYRARCAGELGPGCYVLKRLRPGNAATHLRLAEMRREACVAAAIHHSQVISVLAADVNRTEPHLLLPYIEGVSLERLLTAVPRGASSQSGRRLPIHFALAIARQIACALAGLHSAGWLHGQIIPRHILVSPHGQATLIDLTQARQLSSPEIHIDASPEPPHPYAAPEFFRRGPLAAAADVYGLGATLFHALAGRPPFASLAGQSLVAAHASCRPPDVRRNRPEATLEAAELVSRTLAKEPLRRPTADQLVEWLAELEIAELARAMN